MGMTDQVVRTVQRQLDSPLLERIEVVLDDVRLGRVTEAGAIDTISRLLREHKTEQPVYQKPWG